MALAWVYAQAERIGVAVAAIPGTRSLARLEQNAAALELTLDAEALATLDPLNDQVTGERYVPVHMAEVALGGGLEGDEQENDMLGGMRAHSL